VRIVLPLAEPVRDGAAPADAGAQEPRVAHRGGSETVLLVEDEAGVREFTRLALLRLGYRVIEAGDGAEALAAARGHGGPIDLVLSDVIMPRMTGPQLAAALQRERSSVRILFMSGYVDPAAAGIDLDGAELLLKPFTLADLAAKLRAALEAP
jgi:CheY-like chemotaxis protein